ncbi:BON domain-containing protein [Acidovorax sp. A1169]|uniref:BON domain-containing protein n=1 Tax=Acidovorax sp. A1169 TaxID=3059524 RepID=UPI002737C4ED|nr:BON domain-containing protein [Acidovorax sp. A1169]MDP4076355.1 BON domain-containing protein [Acidovorax sp. A1169]
MKSDSQIQKDVLDELLWEPSVHAAEIGVEVHEGVVTLAGHVNSYAEKFQAEQAAQRVSGVKALAMEIDVKLVGSSKRTDAEIAASVESALQWTNFVSKDSVKVMVEKGLVTLSGDVDWDYQRLAAVTAIRFLRGVKGINDQISIKPKVAVAAVKADIEAALKRRAHTDSHAISVSVKGQAVTLSGKVHSWSERDLAATSAWGTAGVYQVINNIELIS